MQSLKNFDEMSQNEVKAFLIRYNSERLSVGEMAKMTNTYPNKIRRALKSAGYTLRNKSDAQKAALQSGRHKHPTKGVGHSEKTKEKLGDSMIGFYDNLPEQEKQKRKRKAKEIWENKNWVEKDEFQYRAKEGVRKAAKEGSKLEQYIYDKLLQNDYTVRFHRKHQLANKLLHIDLLLPKLGVAIEIDGPSHFKPIWGERALKRTQLTDKDKDGLIIGQGYCLIRIRHKKSLSTARQRQVWNQLHKQLIKIQKEFPPLSKRLIKIGD